MIVEINLLSVFDEMLVTVKMWKTWHHQEDCSRSRDRPWQMSNPITNSGTAWRSDVKKTDGQRPETTSVLCKMAKPIEMPFGDGADWLVLVQGTMYKIGRSTSNEPFTAATGDNSAMRPFVKLLWTLVYVLLLLSWFMVRATQFDNRHLLHKTLNFISPELWPDRPELNSINYKI